MHDLGSIFTGLALILNAIPAIIAALAARQAAKLAVETSKQIAIVHDAVNSKMDRLLAVTKTASHAEGVIEGSEKEKAKESPS